MLFASFSFIIFIIIFTILYFLTSIRLKWLTIILGSLYFYLSLKPEWPFLIFLAVLFNYYMGKWISSSLDESQKKSKNLIYLGVIINLLYLIVFKYANFISDSTRDFLSLFSFHLSSLEISIILPIGISFYTFQNISYLVDIYRRKYKAENHLGIFSAYVLFFPKLTLGPIERAGKFIPQIRESTSFSYDNLISGIRRIVWGLFKKLVIADRLGILVNSIYSNPTNYNTPYLILATVFFGFQIYCDLSSYADIAIGSARILGIRLTENFKRPFLAKNVAEFWRKWHISMSSWFQDYVFVPLYLKVSKVKKLAGISHKNKHMISFIISMLIGETLLGIWHGANWTFAAFGLYYGITISLYYLIRDRWDSWNKYIQIFLTLILSNIAWILFKSNTISDAIYIIKNIFYHISFNIPRRSIGLGHADFIIAIVGIIIIFVYDILEEADILQRWYARIPKIIKALIFIVLILLILMIGVYTYSQFIYAQF